MAARLWRSVALLYALGVLGYMCLGLLSPLVNDLREALRASPEGIGLAIGLQFAPFVLGGTVVGWLADRLGARQVFVIGAMLVGAGDLAESLVHSLPEFMVATFAQGVGMLCVVVSGQTTVAVLTGGRAQLGALSLWATAPPVGGAAGLLLAGQFASTAGWRLAFLVHGGLAALLAVASLAVLKDAPRTSGHRVNLTAVRRESGVIQLSLGMAFATVTFTGSTAVWPSYLSASHGMTVAAVSTLAGSTMLFGVAGSLLAGAALNLGVAVRQLLAPVFGLAVTAAVALYLAGGGVGLLFTAMAAWQLATGAAVAVVFASVPRLVRDPAQLGSATGLLHQVNCLGALAGAPVFLAISQTTNAPVLFTGCVITCFGLMALLNPCWRRASGAAQPLSASSPH